MWLSCLKFEFLTFCSSHYHLQESSVSSTIMVAIVVTTLTLMLVCSCGMCIARNVKLAFVEMVNLAQNIDKNTKDV